MSRLFASILLSILSLAPAVLAQPATQGMVCPNSSAADAPACRVFHYHVQMWKPDSKTFVELSGLNSFGSISSCESARMTQMKANLAVVDSIHRVDNNPSFQPDRVGTCHCDMTLVSSNPNFLTDAARASQFRAAEEVMGKVKDKLLSEKLSADTDLVRMSRPAGTAGEISWNKGLTTPDPAELARVPPAPLSADQIKDTTVATEGLRSAGGAAELTLVDVPSPSGSPAARVASGAASSPSASPTASPEPTRAEPPASEQPGEVPAATTSASTAPSVGAENPLQAPRTEPVVADDGAIDRFIEYETARVQAVLQANITVTDEALKRQIFAAAMQRLQLLSNLRAIIEGAEAKSRLGMAARQAINEESRLALVKKVFGASMVPHWAPREASQILVDIPGTIAADPVAVLRDSSGRYSIDEKRLALFAQLSRNSSLTPTEELWLAGVIESFF